MNIEFNVEREIVIEGKKYKSVEEMPDGIRQAYEKAIASSSAGHSLEFPKSVRTRIVINGKEYESVESMPGEVRQLYEMAMKAVEVGEKSPAALAGPGGVERSKTHLRGMTFSVNVTMPTEPESSRSAIHRWIIAGILLMGVIMGLSYLLRH